MNPDDAALVGRVRRRLRALASPAVAAGMRAYFRRFESVTVYGVKTPEWRSVERDLLKPLRRSTGPEDAIRVAARLGREPELESKGVGLTYLARWVRVLPPSIVATAREWLDAGLASNWATVDHLATAVLAPVLAAHPERLREVGRWTRSPNVWVRRASAVALVPLARRGERLDEAYRTASALVADAEDMVHKAVGWLLREAGRTDRERLRRFLLEHGAAMPRTTVRYAIEHFPPGERRSLRAATRG